jgi:hypothetical protein
MVQRQCVREGRAVVVVRRRALASADRKVLESIVVGGGRRFGLGVRSREKGAVPRGCGRIITGMERKQFREGDTRWATWCSCAAGWIAWCPMDSSFRG